MVHLDLISQHQRRRTLTIVIPAKDEEEGIAQSIRSIPLRTLAAMGVDTDLLVVDGRSTDGTREIARALGATVIEDPGEGKGSALRAAIPHIMSDYVVMVDADGTYATDAIASVVGSLLHDQADVVMGRRTAALGAMSWLHQLGNGALTIAATWLMQRPCLDLCTGLWGFRRDTLATLPIEATRFELEADLFAVSVQQRLRIHSIDVDYLPRHGGSKLSTFSDGWRIGHCLLRRALFVPQALTEPGIAMGLLRDAVSARADPAPGTAAGFAIPSPTGPLQRHDWRSRAPPSSFEVEAEAGS